MAGSKSPAKQFLGAVAPGVANSIPDVEGTPEELFQWSGPSQEELERRRQEAMEDARFNTAESGGSYLTDQQQGFAAQQGRQSDLGQYYRDVLEGRRETAGAAQLQAGGEQALAAALAQSRQAKGAQMGSARYNAMQIGAGAQAQANQQAGIMRAQEQAQAAGAYGGLLNQQQAANLAAFQAMQQSDQFRAELELKRRLGIDLGWTQQQIAAAQASGQIDAAQAQDMLSRASLTQGQGIASGQQATQIAGAGMAGLGAVLSLISDIRAKGDVRPAGGQDPSQFPRQVSGNRQQRPSLSSRLAGSQQSQMAAESQQPQFQPRPLPQVSQNVQPVTAQQAPQFIPPQVMPGTFAPGAPGSAMQAPRPVAQQGVPLGINARQVVPASDVSQRAANARPAPERAVPPIMQQPAAGLGQALASQQLMSDPATKTSVLPAGGPAVKLNLSGQEENEEEDKFANAFSKFGSSLSQGFAGIGKGLMSPGGSLGGSMMNFSSLIPKRDNPQQAAPGGKGGGGLGKLLGITSDERTKEEIVPGGHTVADSFLDALSKSASTYTYKDPNNEPTDNPTGGRYLGIMAQEVEKTPTGDTIVKDGPTGKYLEMGPSLSAALAGLGRVNERLDSVEQSLGKKKSRKK